MLNEKVSYWDNTKYGELYYFSMIQYFRERDLPAFSRKFEHSSKHSSVSDCDILTFGDSFFEFSRIKQFPEKLADDFNAKVHYVNNDFPLQYLEDNSYNDTVPKLVIFERVERYIPIAFKNPHIVPEPKQVNNESKFNTTFNLITDLIFYKRSEELYDVMLKRSYFTSHLYSFLSTRKLDMFKYINEKTPVYKVDGDSSWVFYHDQVNGEKTSFYYKFSDKQIDSICDNMADLATKLKSKYNMDLVYLPLPARYTLYHTVINQDTYNNFMPRLYEGLDKRGVKYIKVFEDFMNAPGYLYFRTDEHWNQKGFDIAYNKTIEYLKTDPNLNLYITDGAKKFSQSGIPAGKCSNSGL